VRGTTEAINLVAQSYSRPLLKPGDEILITHLEHHANIVPWQMVCEQTGATLVVAPIDSRGEVHEDAVVALMSPRHAPVRLCTCIECPGPGTADSALDRRREARGITTLIDGAQAVPHMHVACRNWAVISTHSRAIRCSAPTGVGVLYGREQLLESMPPWKGGGEMILAVTFAKTTYNGLPNKSRPARPISRAASD